MPRLLKQWWLGGLLVAYLTDQQGKEVFSIHMSTGYVRNVKHLRLSQLKQAVTWVCELYEEHKLYTDFITVEAEPLKADESSSLDIDPQKWLEELLDYLYSELNRRLNKDGCS